MALAEAHLQPVLAIQLATYFGIAVMMFHCLVNQVYYGIHLHSTLHVSLYQPRLQLAPYVAIDALEFAITPSNSSVILEAKAEQLHAVQFHCSVRASRVTNFEWTFRAKSHPSNDRSSLHQISDQLGSVDIKYSVLSTDYASTLTIDSVQFSDAGIYTCIASIGGTLIPIEASAHLKIDGK